MKRLLLLFITIWCIIVCGYCQTDWKNFMSKQDMIWTRLPQTWYEAPFMGNGSMGTYICKEPNKNAIRVDVNIVPKITTSTVGAVFLSAISFCIPQVKYNPEI